MLPHIYFKDLNFWRNNLQHPILWALETMGRVCQKPSPETKILPPKGMLYIPVQSLRHLYMASNTGQDIIDIKDI